MLALSFLFTFLFHPSASTPVGFYTKLAFSVLSLIGIVFIIVSFFQIPAPKAFKEEFKLTQRRYGRDPIGQALRFSVMVAVIWGVGVALILGLNSLANGAGIPFMIIWAFIGAAMGLAAFVNLIRSFFIHSAYKKDFWQKFLSEVSSKIDADDD